MVRRLRCHGVKKDATSAVGCAESGHVVCAPCLERWWTAHAQLRQRAGAGAAELVRRICPVCKTELRRTGGEMRQETERYHLGLLKIESSWRMSEASA